MSLYTALSETLNPKLTTSSSFPPQSLDSYVYILLNQSIKKVL